MELKIYQKNQLPLHHRINMTDKVYSNPYPNTKKKTDLLGSTREWNFKVKEKIRKWDAGEVGSNMKILTGETEGTTYNMKKVDPKKRRLDGKLISTEV